MRSLIIGLIAVAATLSGGWFAERAGTGEIADAAAATEIVSIDTIAIPVFAEGRVGGYALFRVALNVPSKSLKAMRLPPHMAVTDALHSVVFGDSRFDFTVPDGIDLDRMRETLLGELTERLSLDIRTVLIEQIDYLARSEIRNRNMRQRDR